MTISGFLIRVIFLAVPGILSYMLFRKLAGRTKREKWEEWCQIVLFSLVIYATFSVVVWLYGLYVGCKAEPIFFKAVLDKNVAIEWSEIIIASLIGVPVAFIASAIHTYKLINLLGQRMRVTRRAGDEDVWDGFHNLPDTPEYQWVFVRDHKTELVYYGWICAYSDSEKERELLMRDVDVYTNDKGEFLYKTGMLYLCRDKYDLTIEARLTNEKSQEKVEDETKETQ